MSDRIQGLTVALDRDYRDDDVEAIVNAIRMVKGVAHVSKSVAVKMEDYVARVRVVGQVQEKIYNIFKEENLKLD